MVHCINNNKNQTFGNTVPVVQMFSSSLIEHKGLDPVRSCYRCFSMFVHFFFCYGKLISVAIVCMKTASRISCLVQKSWLNYFRQNRDKRWHDKYDKYVKLRFKHFHFLHIYVRALLSSENHQNYIWWKKLKLTVEQTGQEIELTQSHLNRLGRI